MEDMRLHGHLHAVYEQSGNSCNCLGFTKLHMSARVHGSNQEVLLRMVLCWLSGVGCMGAAAFQHDRRIRLYETENNWRLRKDVHCRNLRWTVTDTCLSPDQQFLLYASINPTVHMVRCTL